jgi:hypothetical protein
MTSKRRLVSPPQGDLSVSFGRNIHLILKLMADGRVNPLIKLLPVAALLYLVSPFDAPLPLIDDALVLWLGNSLFLELCPQELVEEHRARLEKVEKVKEDRDSIRDADVIDANYRER